MSTDSHKAKHYGLIALKVLILGITFTYIYNKLTQESSLGLSSFLEAITATKTDFVGPLFLFLGLAALNWLFEILKWKSVVSVVKPISFRIAAKQCLAALTISLATPNRIGDYGAKAFFFLKEVRRKILVLNFFSNISQMIVTTIFGAIGIIIMIVNYNLPLSVWKIMIGVLAITILLVLGIKFKEKQLLIKGLSLENLFRFIRELPQNIKVSTVLYSLLRYLTFCYLFFLLLNYFNAEITLLKAMPIIFSMYLLVSIIPSIFIFDVIIRGGISVWLFGYAGLSEWTVLCTVLAMWILNFLIPALIGSLFVVTYKLNRE